MKKAEEGNARVIGFDSLYLVEVEEVKKMHTSITSPDPSILRYVMGVCKADEKRGELIGLAIVIERELNAWIDEVAKKGVCE
jgi:hypothetical protein